MKIAVITCHKYRDALAAFMELFGKFWPDCPYRMTVYSDEPGETWCEVVVSAAKESDEEMLLFQDDFYLEAPVDGKLIQYALMKMQLEGASMIRLYPSPGANGAPVGSHFGVMDRGAKYRISCQASIWRPAFLYSLASQCHDHGEASDFEIGGTRIAEEMPDIVLAARREVEPWPLNYLSSAISRGLWNPSAIALCAKHGIPIDLSLRGIAA